MTFEFFAEPPIDAKLMQRAMKGRTAHKKAARRDWNLMGSGVANGVFLGASGMVFAFIVLRSIPPQAVLPFLFPVLGVLAAFLVMRWTHWSQCRFLARQMIASPIYAGGTRFQFGPDGVSMKSDTSHWRVAWHAIEEVKRGQDGIFMYAGNFIYVLPDQAEPVGDRDTVFDQIKSWARV